MYAIFFIITRCQIGMVNRKDAEIIMDIITRFPIEMIDRTVSAR